MSVVCVAAKSLAAELPLSGAGAVAASGAASRGQSLAEEFPGCAAVVRVLEAFAWASWKGKLPSSSKRPAARAQACPAPQVQSVKQVGEGFLVKPVAEVFLESGAGLLRKSLPRHLVVGVCRVLGQGSQGVAAIGGQRQRASVEVRQRSEARAS